MKGSRMRHQQKLDYLEKTAIGLIFLTATAISALGVGAVLFAISRVWG